MRVITFSGDPFFSSGFDFLLIVAAEALSDFYKGKES